MQLQQTNEKARGDESDGEGGGGGGGGNHLQILSVGTDTVHLCLSTVYDVP